VGKKYRTIFLIALFIQVFAVRGAFAAVLLDRIVAVVNNEVITWSELRSAIAMEEKGFLEKLPEGRKEDAIKGLEKNYLYDLIEMRLQMQEARRTGQDVSDAEISGVIADIKSKYGMTDESLKKSLEAEGLNIEEYKAKLGEQILLSKVVNFEVKTNIVITDKEIGDYYEANKGKFGGEKRRIRQIFFPAPKDNLQKGALEEKAGDIIRRINRGEDFSKLAEELSEDRSRQFGGDLGYISRGSALKEVEDAAFSLNAGEVSKPFWSPAGLHIIKLEDTVGGEGAEGARDKIKEILFQKAFASKYVIWKAGLKEKAHIEIKL